MYQRETGAGEKLMQVDGEIVLDDSNGGADIAFITTRMEEAEENTH